MASVDGFGSVTWWGFSPALNLAALYEQGRSKCRSPELSTVESDHVNVLLVGSGDLRHVMKTVAYASSHTSKPIHFYIFESCLEVLARHMLFLSLLTENPDEIGLQEKTEMFLELYGNSLIRAHTSEYLKKKSSDLIKMITDEDYSKYRLPLLDTSALKFKEHDYLEGIFKFWRDSDDKVFDISKHWENRLRHYLGVRYDSRSGVYDWDYHMKLKEMTTSVSGREYSEWRETGLAFQLRKDVPYKASNQTLASGLLVTQGGEKVTHRGYWGDVVNSPYITFGIESVNKDLFKSQNGMNVHTSVSISNYNITSLIYKLTTGREYSTVVKSSGPDQRSSCDDQCHHQQEVVIEETDKEDSERDVTSQEGANVGDCTLSRPKGPIVNGSCYVSFLPLGCVPDLCKKAKHRRLFNIVYFSNSMVHHLKDGIEATFAPDCSLVVETAKFMLDLKKEQKTQYETKVTSMAKALGFKVPLVVDKQTMSSHLVFTS